MRAAQLIEPGRFAVRTLRPLGSRALLDISACGICHSDRKAYQNPPRGMKLPRVLGHELTGNLLCDLPAVDLRKDDRVVVWPAINCSKCFFCMDGRENLCRTIRLFGYHLDGGFAEKLFLSPELFDVVRLVKVPENISAEEATFCEPLGCVLNGFRKIGFSPRRCLVVGAGLMGRLAARVARALFGMEVMFHEIDRRRLEYAMADGRFFDGCDADVVFIAASGQDAVQFGLQYLAPGGTILLFSGQPGNCRLALDHNEIHQMEQRLMGVYGCCFNDMREAMRLLSEREVEVDDLLSRRIALDELSEEMTGKVNKDEYKIVIINQ